jgi:hypothetical protein
VKTSRTAQGSLSETSGQPLIDEADSILAFMGNASQNLNDGSEAPGTAGAAADGEAAAVELMQNYPNPFNPETEISFVLPEATDVPLAVYDMTGREIAQLLQGTLAEGCTR